MNKQNIFIGSGIGAVILLVLFIMMHKTPVIQPTRGTTVIAFGDSLVAGVGATAGNDFVSVLSQRLGTPILNMGISGDTTTGALARLERDVLVRDPRVVIVVLGGNDYLRRIPPSETLTNIRTIVSRIQSQGAAVILVGISRLVYNSDYEAIASELNVQFVPHLLDETVSHPDLMSDSIHPNDAGYLIFADKVEPYIRKVL